jgi:hypothetical protein
MCGEIDEQERIDEELFERFLNRVSKYDITPSTSGHDTPPHLDEEDARNAYMNALFKAALTRTVNDAANLPNGERMDILAGQAIVFARIAGFLAAQFPPENDLFRTTIAALMEGHKEVVKNERRIEHHHHHHDHHSH